MAPTGSEDTAGVQNWAPASQAFCEGIEETLRCSICLDQMVLPTSPPCGHSFCYECINEVAKTNNMCPLCKTKFQGLSTNYVLRDLLAKLYGPKYLERCHQVSIQRDPLAVAKQYRKSKRYLRLRTQVLNHVKSTHQTLEQLVGAVGAPVDEVSLVVNDLMRRDGRIVPIGGQLVYLRQLGTYLEAHGAAESELVMALSHFQFVSRRLGQKYPVPLFAVNYHELPSVSARPDYESEGDTETSESYYETTDSGDDWELEEDGSDSSYETEEELPEPPPGPPAPPQEPAAPPGRRQENLFRWARPLGNDLLRQFFLLR